MDQLHKFLRKQISQGVEPRCVYEAGPCGYNIYPQKDTAPLIYPCHFLSGFINWPLESGKKPNAITASADTSDLLVESGFYVLTKRFSSKEQQRRVMAAIYDPVRLADGQEIRLSPGGQNVLIKKVMDDFCPLFTPGSYVVYIGDTQAKWTGKPQTQAGAEGIIFRIYCRSGICYCVS